MLTSRLSVVGSPNSGARRNADLINATLEEVVGVTVVRVSGLNAGGHGRNGGGSDSSLHVGNRETSLYK